MQNGITPTAQTVTLSEKRHALHLKHFASCIVYGVKYRPINAEHDEVLDAPSENPYMVVAFTRTAETYEFMLPAAEIELHSIRCHRHRHRH
jgi:hypothetical protein